MNVFSSIIKDIFRLKVPFDKIYTSVFLIKANEEYILVDCATTDYDVKNYIVSAIQDMGICSNRLKYLVLSHTHSDHAGGLQEMLRQYPNLQVVTEIKKLADGIITYPMAGHTRDCIGVLDLRTKTLISADGIQGYGVDRYPCSLHDETAYIQTLKNVETDERIENILFSHAYEPWCKDFAFGREEIKKCLRDSLNHIIKRRQQNESNCN